MIFITFLLFSSACTAAVNVPSFSWESRPQLIAFTFEGSPNTSSDSSVLLSQFSNGRLSCTDYVPATWFATECTDNLQSLQSNHFEIAAFNANQSNISCLRSNAGVVGVRMGNITSTSGFHYTMLESPTYIWPYLDSNITRVPFVNATAAALMSALSQNYDGARAPIVVSVSNMLQNIGAEATTLMLQQIMSLDEVVAVTVGQLSQLTNAKSASDAESIVNVCRLLPSNGTSSSGNVTPTSRPTLIGTTTIPAKVNGTTQPSTEQNGAIGIGTTAPGTNHSAGARTNATIVGQVGPSTTAPTETSTLSPSIVGDVPANDQTDSGTDSSDKSSSTSSKATGYVPYVIGIGGGLCAMAVAIVYKVFKKEDRFPPVITNGYVFDAEDREIYDLEACNNSVRAVPESGETNSSSYVDSDLESISLK